MKKKILKSVDLFNLNKFQLIHLMNKLELENETLKDTIRDELYKTFMDKLNEPQELERLRNEVKNLRIKVKTLKQLLKGEAE